MDIVGSTNKNECPLFACRECRTKAGLKHQKWCSLSEEEGGGCDSCVYYSPKRKKCRHPRKQKGGDVP